MPGNLDAGGKAEALAAARLFASSSVKELARHGRSRTVCRLLGETGLLAAPGDARTLGDLYDSAFGLLKQRYRNEYIYRAALTHKVLLGRHSLNTAVMLNEFRVGDCKADVVVLNGTSTVYEIKSERDSLARLASQVAAYRRVFMRVNVVTADRHVEEVATSVSSDVGILQLTRRGRISTVRPASDDVGRIAPLAVFDCLQTREVEAVLRYAGESVPRVSNVGRRAAFRPVFAGLSSERAHEAMVAVLKSTRSQAPLRDFIAQCPSSLQAAALAVPLSRSERTRLHSTMGSTLASIRGWE